MMGTTAAETWALALLLVGSVCVMGGCTPRVEVVPSDKPITINLNVNIKHEILVKVDKQLDSVFSEQSGIF